MRLAPSPPPIATTYNSGTSVFTLSTGGVDTTINGTVTTTVDSSSTSGTLTLGQATSLLFVEDSTGRLALSPTTTTTPSSIVYAINPKRAVCRTGHHWRDPGCYSAAAVTRMKRTPLHAAFTFAFLEREPSKTNCRKSWVVAEARSRFQAMAISE